MAIWWDVGQPAANSCRPDSPPPQPVLIAIWVSWVRYVIPLVFTECKHGYTIQSQCHGMHGTHWGPRTYFPGLLCVSTFQLAPRLFRGLALWLPPAFSHHLCRLGLYWFLESTDSSPFRGTLRRGREIFWVDLLRKHFKQSVFSTSEPLALNLTALQDAHLG